MAGILTEEEIFNKYLDDTSVGNCKLLSELACTDSTGIREIVKKRADALLSSSDNVAILNLVAKFERRLGSRASAISHLAKAFIVSEEVIEDKCGGLSEKKSRRQWTTAERELVVSEMQNGKTVRQILNIMKLPESDYAKLNSLCVRLRKEHSIDIRSIRAKMGKEVVTSPVTTAVKSPVVEDLGNSSMQEGQTLLLGGEGKSNQVSNESLYHEYVCKIKSLENLISVKKREVALLQALKVEYTKLCNDLRPEGGTHV